MDSGLHSQSASGRQVGPLTFSQRRIWLEDQMSDAQTGMESHTIQVRFSGVIEPVALRSALAVLIQRHSVLRTTFHSDGGDPYQRIWNGTVRPFIAEIDLSNAPADGIERSISEILAREARSPFNLARGPMGRCVFVKRSDGCGELLLTLHRIVFDDSSIGVLADELRALYVAEVTSTSATMRRHEVQLVDAALQEYQCAEVASVRERLAFWQKHLDGANPLFEVPADFTSQPAGVNAPGHVRIPLDTTLLEELGVAATSYGVPVHVPLIAAWAVLLARLSAQGGVVTGLFLPRDRFPVLGPLDDIVPLHVRDCDSGTVAQLISQVAASIAAIERMPYTPPEWIVSSVRGGLSEEALHRFMIRVEMRNDDVAVEPHWNIQVARPAWLKASSFEIALSIQCSGKSVSADLFYAPQLFSRRTASGFAERLLRLVRGMLDGQTQVGSVSLLSTAEHRRVVTGFNSWQREGRRVQRPVAHETLLHELFEQQVHRRPRAVALVCGKTSMTYAGLNARANRLAHYLRAEGVRQESLVAICMERSAEMIVSMLAVLKAGGAYVPLDPGHPAQRLYQILADSGASIMLGRSNLKEVCASLGLRLINPRRKSDSAAIGRSPAHRPRRITQPSNLAYVIYTSGSSGEPKGVLIEHRNAVNATLARHRYYGRVKRWLLTSPIAFDSSVAVIYGALTGGGTLVVATDALMHEPRKLARKIVSEHIECALTVPEFLRQILEALGQTPVRRGTLRLITAGDVCSKAIAQSAQALGIPLFNEYGPTEATVWATVHDCSELPGSSSVPIGRPIDTAKIYILDSHQAAVPVGVVGEIYIAGGGVARGYLKRPELSEERFVRDPFDRGQAGRMYRTGDLGRWRPDGCIEFCGRRDSQVKVRGYRIELEDIESHLADIDGVDAAAMTWNEADAGPRRLIAHVVCGNRARFRPRIFHELLSRRLPSFMLPSAYVRLDALPVTSNGKIDRAALPRTATRNDTSTEYSAPRGPLEIRVATLWAQVLGVSRPGRRDNFFQLGGDSLNATRLVELCRREGARVSVPDLFRSPTLLEFARLLQTTKRQRARNCAAAR